MSDTNVVPLMPTRKGSDKSIGKWGKEVWDVGHTGIPTILFQAQHRLGLNSVQLCVLLQLADFWWDQARRPYPSKKVLSQRIGLGERHIQRTIAELEEAGFVRRIARTSPGKGKVSNEYDLSGLARKLAELAPEFQKVRDEAKAKRAALVRPAWSRSP